MKKDRSVQKILKDKLIQMIANTSGENISTVENVLKSMENIVLTTLKEADNNKDISIKIFDGFFIDSTYIPEKKQQNNLTGKIIDVASKIKVKARITRGYAEKINQ